MPIVKLTINCLENHCGQCNQYYVLNGHYYCNLFKSEYKNPTMKSTLLTRDPETNDFVRHDDCLKAEDD